MIFNLNYILQRLGNVAHREFIRIFFILIHRFYKYYKKNKKIVFLLSFSLSTFEVGIYLIKILLIMAEENSLVDLLNDLDVDEKSENTENDSN